MNADADTVQYGATPPAKSNNSRLVGLEFFVVFIDFCWQITPVFSF